MGASKSSSIPHPRTGQSAARLAARHPPRRTPQKQELAGSWASERVVVTALAATWTSSGHDWWPHAGCESDGNDSTRAPATRTPTSPADGHATHP
eukprot:7942475-Alexandrium_andersonii.AAC.1